LSAFQNQLIAGLPSRARASLLAMGERVELTLSEVLCDPGARMRL